MIFLWNDSVNNSKWEIGGIWDGGKLDLNVLQIGKKQTNFKDMSVSPAQLKYHMQC